MVLKAEPKEDPASEVLTTLEAISNTHYWSALCSSVDEDLRRMDWQQQEQRQTRSHIRFIFDHGSRRPRRGTKAPGDVHRLDR